MSTLETLQGLLIKEYKLTPEQVAPEAQLATVGVDSLGMIELMLQIEEGFGITLPDDKAPVLTTVNDLAIYIDGLVVAQGKKPPAAASAASVA